MVVMFPLRLVISRDRVLAFDPQDPTVRLMIDELAHSLKLKQPLDVPRVRRRNPGQQRSGQWDCDRSDAPACAGVGG